MINNPHKRANRKFNSAGVVYNFVLFRLCEEGTNQIKCYVKTLTLKRQHLKQKEILYGVIVHNNFPVYSLRPDGEHQNSFSCIHVDLYKTWKTMTAAE